MAAPDDVEVAGYTDVGNATAAVWDEPTPQSVTMVDRRAGQAPKHLMAAPAGSSHSALPDEFVESLDMP